VRELELERRPPVLLREEPRAFVRLREAPLLLVLDRLPLRDALVFGAAFRLLRELADRVLADLRALPRELGLREEAVERDFVAVLRPRVEEADWVRFAGEDDAERLRDPVLVDLRPVLLLDFAVVERRLREPVPLRDDADAERLREADAARRRDEDAVLRAVVPEREDDRAFVRDELPRREPPRRDCA
jgi:hypothetical protein